MKKVLIASIFAALTMGVNAQIKVETTGSVGLGTINANLGYPVTINQNTSHAGGVLLQYDYPGHAMRLAEYPANGHVGSSNDALVFYYSGLPGYNKVYAQAYYTASDRSIKSNIKTIDNGLSNILKLRGVSYVLKEDEAAGTPRKTYGFISQEVAEFLPELTSEQEKVLCMDYTQIIPMLVSGMQEQQAQITQLQSEIDALRNGETPSVESSKMILGQNNPNPFKESTAINYTIPETTRQAMIVVYDLQGAEQATYRLDTFGEGTLRIEGKTFKAGMYMYALIVDGQLIDSKRMVLTK